MPENALLTPEEARELFIDVIDEDGYWEYMALDEKHICSCYKGPVLDYWKIEKWINNRDESIGELTIKYKSINEFITYLEELENEYKEKLKKFIKLDKWINGEIK
jgi:hypothetical protein